MKLRTIKAADLFAGAGGASTGLVRACEELGLSLDLLAINHWPTAIKTHLLNHPTVRHLCESIERVDPLVAVPSGRLHLLMAGPECTHFSTARGGRPVNPQSRASAWGILKWAQELYIDTILIENVPEFRTWGPIGANHKPLKSKKGETYQAFLAALRSLGYTVDDRILNAADYGDPTTRKRLFILARRGRHAVSWPAPTHSRTGAATLFGRTKRWRPAREVIDWSVPGKSIFTRKKPLKPATIARILAGLEKFGGPELQPFLAILRGTSMVRSVDEPVPTITTSGAHFALCEPFIVPVNHGAHELRSRSIEEPLPTLTGRANQYLVEPFVLQQQSGGVPRHVKDPLPTIATDGAISLVEPFLVEYHGAKPGERPRVYGVNEPLKTQSTENRFGLAQPFLVPFYGERSGQVPRTHSVDEPLPVIPASGDGKFGVVEPFVISPGGANLRNPRGTSKPLPTIMGSDRLAVVEPFLTKYNRTATGAYSVDEPIDTISTRDRFGLVQPVVDGYVLDIHFRMLQPHELAAATSFPRSYQFQGNREDVIKQIGNAWPGELAKALCTAVLEEYAPAKRQAWTAEAIA